MKHIKRSLCLVLAVCVILSAVPAQIFARSIVRTDEDVTDEQILAGSNFYLASTNMNFAENTPSDYEIRIGRGGECNEPASVTVKFEDFSAHYGKDYTACLADGTKPVCPKNAMAVTDLFMGDYTVTRQQTEEEAAQELPQEELAEAMAQANALVRELTGIEPDSDAPLSPLEHARAAQTGIDAPQQRLTATDQTEEQLAELSGLLGELIPGASVKVEFAAGEREKFLTVHPIDNKTADGDRYFTVRLTDGIGTAISSADGCYVTIIDDEQIEPCEVSFGEISQEGGTLTVNVERTGCINQITHLKLTAKPDGTAVEGRDFSGVETDVLFPMGAPATQITVPVNTAYLEADADFTLELTPVANAQVVEPSKRVELRATPVETRARDLTTVCVNADLADPRDHLVSTRHSGNFAGLLFYNEINEAFEMKWTYSSFFKLPWWGKTEAVFNLGVPERHYSGVRVTLAKDGDDADLSIGWGSLDDIMEDDDFEWNTGKISPAYKDDDDLTKQDKVYYLPENIFGSGMPIEIENRHLLRFVNDAWCRNCDKVSIYAIAPIYRWFIMELTTDEKNAPEFLTATGDRKPYDQAADAFFALGDSENPTQIQFHLDETLQLSHRTAEPYCKIKSLSTSDGLCTFELKNDAITMDDGALDSLMLADDIEWNENKAAGIAPYGTIRMNVDYEYTDANILIKDSEDGSYGNLKLSGTECPARGNPYTYHRGDIVYVTCDLDPVTAAQMEFKGIRVRTKLNESDMSWHDDIIVNTDENGGAYLHTGNKDHRLDFGYYEITPIFNYKYNTVTVRVEKAQLDRFDQSYGIFSNVTPKTVQFNGVTYAQFVFPNAQKDKIYSFAARGRDGTYCPIWREDKDPKAINYSGECFYYTARDAADKNYIYLTAEYRPAGYQPVTVKGTLLRKGYNALSGFTDDDTVDVIEGAIAVCGESSCLTGKTGEYTLQALSANGKSVRYLLSVNGRTVLREVAVSKQTVTDTVTLNPENGTLVGALNISFAETDATGTVLVLDNAYSHLTVSDDGGYPYQQNYRKADGTIGTKTALERLTAVTAVIRDTDGSIRATFNAEPDGDGRFACDLEHSALCGGDRVYLKITTDRLADCLAAYDEEGNLINPDAVTEKGRTEYAEVFSGYSFTPTWREELPVVLDVDCLPTYTTGRLPFIGEAGYDFTMGPVNLAIEERDGEYFLRLGISAGRVLEYAGVIQGVTNYEMGKNGAGSAMYGGDFMGTGNLQERYTGFIKNIWGEVFGEDKNDPASKGGTPAKLGGLAWRFDVIIGLYFKFSRLEAYGGGMNGQRSDFYFTGWGGYLALQAGYNITHYFIIPVIFLPVYVGLQFDASLIGSIGESIDRNNLTHPLADMSSVTGGYVDIGQSEFDQTDGSIRFSIIGTVFGGVGIYGYLGLRLGGRIIAIGLWEPCARDEITEDSGSIAFLSVGGWADLFLFSVPLMYTFEPVRNGIFKEYMTQTNAPDGVSVQVGEMSVRKPYNEKPSAWKGNRPALRSGFSEASVQTLVENPYEHPEAKLVSLKNGDVMLAYVDKLDTDDLIDRTVLKLSRYRGGKWSEPVTVQPDGRADFQPSLCETKDGKVLVSWVSTDTAWKRGDTNLDFLRSLDVFSAVVDPETMAVTELTQLTDDEYYDSAPIAVCDMESGEYAVYYTKAGDEDLAADGSVITRTAEELLNVYSNGSIIAYQLHADSKDGRGARWLFDYYFPSEYATEADRDYLLANWNGQRFLAAPIEELDIAAANIADLTATTYNGLSALAYTVDADSSNDTNADKELFVQYYRFSDHKLFVPVRLTDDAVADAVPQFARSTGENAETLLFWLRDNKDVTYLSVSDLIREGTADDGTILDTYRAGENNAPSEDLTRLYLPVRPGGAEPDSAMQWSNFRTAVTDDDIYVVWTQPTGDETETVELYATALIRSDETENCGTDWSNPYRLTYDGRIADTPELAVDTNGSMIAVYNSYEQQVTDDAENPLIIKDLNLRAATLILCGAVEIKNITIEDETPTAGQEIEITMTLVNNGLTFAEGYELELYEKTEESGGTLLETVTSDARMRPAQEAKLTYTWTVPADFDGTRFLASVKETGGAWTNLFERESEPLRAVADLELTEPVTYQDKTGIRMAFDITNNGSAASTDKDTLALMQVGPFNSDCGLTEEEQMFAEQSLAGIAAGETKHFDIAVNAPDKAFEKFGYVSCIADILHGEELTQFTAVDIRPTRVLDIRWNGSELPETLSLNIGESADATVTAVPAGSAYANLYSSDPTVVDIIDGKLVAVGAGTAEITGILLPSGETFGPITVTVQPKNPFIDVHETDWFHGAVMNAYGAGLMAGTSENTFSPDMVMTRAMLVTVLYQMQGKPEPTKENPFKDVPAGQWYTKAVIWAAENGIVSGTGNGCFAPEDPVTREQVAVILRSYAKFCGIDTEKAAELNFTDTGKVSSWALPAMKWAVAEGLLSGKLNNGVLTLDPQGRATRAEAAAILTAAKRLLQ